MKVTGLRTLLMAGTGLAMVSAMPALAQQQQQPAQEQQPAVAQDQQQCVERLDQIEQQISQAQLEAEQQGDIEEILEGARTLAEQGDEQGCMSVVAELEQVVVTLEDAGRLETEPQAAETEMQPAETEAEVTETEVPVELETTDTQPEAEVTEGEPTDPAQPEAEVTEAEPTEPAAAASPLAAMSADDLIGTSVVNEQGDTIGEIVDLVTTPDEQMHAVLSVGGFLGIGAREVVVPLEEFQIGADDEVVLAGMTEDALQQMPEYDETQYQAQQQQ